jgi:hypothetical protein
MSFLDQIQVIRLSREKCDVCRKIKFAYRSKGRKYYSEKLGKMEDLYAMKCPTHTPLLKHIAQILLDIHGIEAGKQGEIMLDVSRDVWSTSVIFFAEDPKATDPFKGLLSCGTPLEVMGKKSEERKPKFGFGQVLDEKWIEPQKFLQWYSNCKKDHGSKCHDPEYLALLPTPAPQYVIDTVDKCLVPAKRSTSYVALSYVWGQVNCLKTNKGNIQQLQQPGALEIEKNAGTIPKTIVDAMNLLALLHERYLWVDTLCIVQDDEQAMEYQLQTMASIFAYAELVIIAAEGKDSEYGLRGIQELPGSVPRNLVQTIVPFGNEKFISRIFDKSNSRQSDIQRKKYFRRGWTFQEYMYSRRRLVFEKESVCFECRQSTMFEDLKYVAESAPWDHEYIEFFYKNGSPSLTVYLKMVNLINNRDFTYPEDILSSFAGTTTTLLRLFTGGFLCGLPEMFFDVALLWQPETEAIRRYPQGERAGNGNATRSVLPSWSWAGWHGLIQSWSWATGTDFSASSRGLIARSTQWTVPITTWYTADKVDSDERRKIEVLWSEWRERYKNEKEPLPKGWKRSRHKPGSRRSVGDYLSPDGYGKYLYTHESTSFNFWYPIPLSNPDPQPKPRLDTQYIFSKVQSTYLFASLLQPNGRLVDKLYISLIDSRGRWAGSLRLHCVADLEQLQEELQTEKGMKMQLVAISSGSVLNDKSHRADIDQYEWDLRPKGGERYEFYNALWIGWENQVAYRKALGRVSKNIWDEQELKSIDLVLG